MNFFNLLFERISDGFSQHPTFFIYAVISLTGIIVLYIDLRRFKYNQVGRQVSSRIGKTEGEEGFDITKYFVRYLSSREEKISKDLEKANVLFTVKEYMTMLVVFGLLGVVLGLTAFPLAGVWKGIVGWLPFEFTKEIFGRLLAAATFGFIGSFAPKAYLLFLIERKRKLMATQIQDSLMNIADALNSGHVIGKAIEIVGYETPYPLGNEFLRAHSEMETGKTLEDALEDMKKRVDLSDFTMAINAIEIQYEVGGKLEPLLRNIAKIINERQELKKDIEKTISSSKMVGVVLLCAPIFFAIVFTMLNKEQFAVMFEVLAGQLMIAAGLVCYAIAAALIFWVIRDASKET